MTSHSYLRQHWTNFRCGAVSRREFITRATAVGISGPMALALVNSVYMEEAGAQEATPERPGAGTNGQSRGTGGELLVRQWLAATELFMHHWDGNGLFPFAASQISSAIVEPLLSYAPDGRLLPTLAVEVPSKANGGLSDDLGAVTIRLREDVRWSDGEPFSADDVVWTWQWIMDEANASLDVWAWSAISNVEAIDETTVRLDYAEPTLAWFTPIAGSDLGGIIPRHFWEAKNIE